MMNKITLFVKNYIPPIDRLLLLLIALIAINGLIYQAVNYLGPNFHGVNYLPPLSLYLFAATLVLLIVGWYSQPLVPTVGFTARSIGMGYLILMSFCILGNGMQFTPFARIDHVLEHWDSLFGIHLPAVMRWTYAHPTLASILNTAYDSIYMQLFILPAGMALLLEKKSVNIFFLSLAMSFIIGVTIYYFFPTSAPSSIFSSSYFLPQQHDTYIKYYEIHHYLPVTTALGGMISFPSFHVIWLCLLTVLVYPRKWLFFPLAIWNLIAIAATVLLGWHYFIDIIASFVLTWFTLLVSIKLTRTFHQSSNNSSQTSR